MDVETSVGKFTLRRPTAGVRNRALMKSEDKDGIKQSVFLFELLPDCVASHPFGISPLKPSLEAMSYEDYDKLVDGLKVMLSPGDVAKKLEEPSVSQGELMAKSK